MNPNTEMEAERDRLRAEVMEQARLLGMSGSREADLRAQLEASLKARVAELGLKVKEREQIAADDCELIYSLRAQLEAAKADGDTWRRLAERLEHEKQSQLAAQPDGGREEAKASAWTAYFAIRSALDDLDRALQDQALAAPAPAPVCKTCGGDGYGMLDDPCPDCAKEGE